MELSKIVGILSLPILLVGGEMCIESKSETNSITLPYGESGRIQFLIRQGRHQQAIELYQAHFKTQKTHDFELIHAMGLSFLDYGFRQNDPEIQLLSLFGASVAAHDDAFYIIEESSRSRYPQIQLIALIALARSQNERADQALIRGLSSSELIIRLEAVHQLCKKKHPQAIVQTESLMYKTPKDIWPIYPQLFALIGTPPAIRHLRKLLNDSSKEVRLAAILSAAKQGRDDLLPQIRQSATHFSFAEQEACAYSLGLFKDHHSLLTLQRLAKSQYPQVALAAQRALYHLGKEEMSSMIEQAAKQGDLFAINALGTIKKHEETLIKLLKDSNLQIRLNASLALLEQHHPACLSALSEWLIRDHRDLAFSEVESPGGVFKVWKAIPSASRLLKDDHSAYAVTVEFKESILEDVREFSESGFLQLADQILDAKQNDLVPLVVELLQEMETEESLQMLKKYQQKPGAPLVRNYCNLALYCLKEPGPYGDQLRQWVESQRDKEMIQFRPQVPWQFNKGHYDLTPEETSRLLIEAFEAFTINQDNEGIEALIHAIQYGNPKNKYALAGLLLRATQ